MKEALAAFIQSLFATQGQIPLHAPFISNEESEAAAKTIRTGLFSTAGKAVAEFEGELANYLKVPHVLATNSGTSALHTALLGCGVGEGDLVVTQALSFVASANTISYCGAEPVFLDVDKERLSLSPVALENFLSLECDVVDAKCIHKKSRKIIKACVVVHTFGHPAFLDEIISLLNRYHIDLVEDAAQAFGSKYKGKLCGTFGRFGCFSFNGNKIITTGGGGALICKNKRDYEQASQLINQGKHLKNYHYYHSVIGYNYAMSGINAAVGIVQINRMGEIMTIKHRISTAYASFFEQQNIQTLIEPPECTSNFWLNSFWVETEEEKDEIIRYLNEKKIEARPVWWPLTELPMYFSANKGSCEMASKVFQRLISLPSGSLYIF